MNLRIPRVLIFVRKKKLSKISNATFIFIKTMVTTTHGSISYRSAIRLKFEGFVDEV